MTQSQHRPSTESRIQSARLLRIAAQSLVNAGFDSAQPTVLLDVPLHTNVGDSLITLGELRLLRMMNNGSSPPARHVGSRNDALDATLERVPDGANVLLQGGGNFGDVWPRSHIYRLETTRRLSRRASVIWLPQSLWFRDPDGELARKTRQVLSEYKPTVLLRDHASIERFEYMFDQSPRLCPDLGLCAVVPPSPSPRTAAECHLKRRDVEAVMCAAEGDPSWTGMDWGDVPRSQGVQAILDRIARKIVQLSPDNPFRRTSLELWAFTHLTESRVSRGTALFGSAQIVHTDRLHAAILALLTGRDVRVEDNNYGKVGAVLQTWSDYIDTSSVR